MKSWFEFTTTPVECFKTLTFIPCSGFRAFYIRSKEGDGHG